jgi:hypothetical protein
MGDWLLYPIWERLENDRSRGGRGDRGGVSGQELADLAARLGGQVVGDHAVRVGDATVRFYSSTSFYIYDASAWWQTRRFICERLGLEPPPPMDSTNEIRRIIREVRPATNSIVECYLRSRGIRLLPPLLQYHPALRHTDTKTEWPGMVVERQNAAGDVMALHRTFLTVDGRKAPVEPVRKDLGESKGTAIRLSPIAEELLIGEGIETVLSGMQLTGKPGWAAGSAVMLRLLVLPPQVRRVTILVDGDDEGEHASQAAAARWFYEDREVKLARAGRDKDFNDLLLEESRK